MTQKQFEEVVTTYIRPILVGAEVVQTINTESPVRIHELAALIGNGQVMHVSPDKKSSYKVELKRNQVFTGDDTKLVREIVAQIESNYEKNDVPYQERVIGYAIEVGLCKFLSEANFSLLVGVLDGFSNWSSRTYEGRKPTFSIVIDFEKLQTDDSHPLILDILKEDFSALLSNSIESGLLVSANGALIDYISFDQEPVVNNSFAPFKFMKIANYSDGQKVCFMLTNSGDILIFKNKRLFFSKRNGSWSYYSHEHTIKTLSGSSVDVKIAMYETALDVSFAHTGGCIAAILPANTAKLVVKDGEDENSIITRDDLINNPSSIKSKAINQLVKGLNFQSMGRVLRKELVGIDGATIINYKGEVMAVGAIIKIRGGSTGGGRLAATKALAVHGAAIKISADGMVNAFNSQKDGTIKLAFKL